MGCNCKSDGCVCFGRNSDNYRVAAQLSIELAASNLW